MEKIEYSIELTKLLESLKTNNPTQLQNRKVLDLNQEERGIYMKASKKQPKPKADDAPSIIPPPDEPTDIESP